MSNASSSSIALKDLIYNLQLCLLEGIKSETQLLIAGSLLSKPDYQDVVTERSIAQICGYPLCVNSLRSSETPKKGRYSICLKEHKVYDLLETHMYCSTKCVVESRAFAGSLQDERSLEFDGGNVDKVMRLFEGLKLKDEEGLGKLLIKEKEDQSVVSMEEWIGPSNAIEGYVPRTSINRPDGKPNRDGKEEESMLNFTSSIITQEDGGQTKKNNKHLNFTSSIITQEDGGQTKKNNKHLNFPSSIITQEDGSQTKKNNKHAKLKVEEESKVGLKSCLKSEPYSVKRNVTLAYDDNNNNRTQVSKNGKETDKVEEQLSEAEVCAQAERQNVAASEDSEASAEPTAQLKWPKKTGIVESDYFDYEDSLFDTTPEEFVVNLSPFATMFMSLFAWVSSSTLAYVYGGEDSFDYASINGREYPQKIASSDGRSSEIKQTLAACLARSLPTLVLHLRLATPLSTIESGMACLLDTMSFLDPLPALRIKQWHVFLLLFLEALSVSRIPALASHLTTSSSFFHKVLEDGQISREEYKVLKDLILPLGRFAMQSGA